MARFGCDSSRCHYPVIRKSSTINNRFTGNFHRKACSDQKPTNTSIKGRRDQILIHGTAGPIKLKRVKGLGAHIK
jgi:hypothetical protein